MGGFPWVALDLLEFLKHAYVLVGQVLDFLKQSFPAPRLGMTVVRSLRKTLHGLVGTVLPPWVLRALLAASLLRTMASAPCAALSLLLLAAPVLIVSFPFRHAFQTLLAVF